MAGFTGLSLLHGASQMTLDQRKRVVCYASIALGGGIWSMHFVAMLGLQLPVAFYYDPLVTLISALMAILLVGVALLILHFRTRTNVTKTTAGIIVGVGILGMHYMGMSGIERCLPIYDWSGLAVAVFSSIALSVGAIWIAYGERSKRNIILGTLCFGGAVFAVHFVAMFGTSFIAIETAEAVEKLISNQSLAYIVTLGAFLICGAFLLITVTFIPERQTETSTALSLATAGPDATRSSLVSDEDVLANNKPVGKNIQQIPFEKNGTTFFIHPENVAAIRAEGHYTIVYSQEEKLFCPWSISEAEKRLPEERFIKTHRSYLINPSHVTGFERKKDNGICFFEEAKCIEKVPVSRSRLPAIREALGLA